MDDQDFALRDRLLKELFKRWNAGRLADEIDAEANYPDSGQFRRSEIDG